MRSIALLLSLLVCQTAWAGAASSDFGGGDDYVNYGDIPALDDATALTVGVWVYNDNVTQDHHIFGQWSGLAGILFFADDACAGSGRTNCYSWRVQDSGADVAVIETATNSSVATSWQWIVGTFEAGSATGLRIYINNVEDANSPADASAVGGAGSTNRSFVSGVRGTDSLTLDRNGKLAYLQAWNRVLSASEMEKAKWCPGSVPEGLQLFDTMLDGGATHEDLSGNNEDGTVVSAVTDSPEGPPVMIGCGGAR